jgi:hypothetical protein
LRNLGVLAPNIPLLSLLCLAIAKIEIRLGMLAGKFRLPLFVQNPPHKSKTGRFLGWPFLETVYGVNQCQETNQAAKAPARPPPVMCERGRLGSAKNHFIFFL